MTLMIRVATCGDEAEVVALWRACGLVGTDEGDRIVAAVMVGHDGHRGWLYYVATENSARRRGHGRQVVGAAEDWLRARGVVKAQLTEREENAVVAAFYERLGFEPTPRLVMGKWLARNE